MTREEAINNLESLYNEVYNEDSDGYIYAEAIDMAIEALQNEEKPYKVVAEVKVDIDEIVERIKEKYVFTNEVVRCEDCKYQDKCKEVILFDINDNEVMGHRVHWCSYGERR
jgi:hypothetical protein